MKETGQRRNSGLSRGPATTRPLQEITVVQHFPPNPIRTTPRTLPEVRPFNDLPESSRYLHLYPMFKFVDSFLNTASLANKPQTRIPPQPVNKRKFFKSALKCTPPESKANATKKTVALPCRPCNPSGAKPCRQERIDTNINNINSQSDMRVSLKGAHCANCRCGDKPPPKEAPQISEYSLGIGSQYYIEKLKSEIKQNKIVTPNVGCDYANKLKMEMEASRSKYLDDARGIINELKNEILNYRLQAKVKYSSSCSDLEKSGQVVQKSDGKGAIEPAQVGDKKGDVLDSSPDSKRQLVLRHGQIETLWRSRGSLQSSSDIEEVSAIRNINFDEKLEEANYLIEKVGEVLREIGKGIYKLPEQKSPQKAETPVKDCPDIFGTEIKNGQKEKDTTKEVDDSNQIQRDGQKKECLNIAECKQLQKKGSHEVKHASESNDRREKKEHVEVDESKKRRETFHKKPNLSKSLKLKNSKEVLEIKRLESTKEVSEKKISVEFKEESLETSQDQRDIKSSDEIERNFKRQKERDLLQDIQDVIQAAPILENCDCSGTQSPATRSTSLQDCTESMDLLKEKLRALSDFSESNISLEAAELVDQDKSLQKRDKKSELVVSYNERVVTRESIPVTDSTKSLDEEKNEENRPKKMGKKLSVQVMPSVSIRRGLVMQKTLHLTIKPTGSVIDDLVAKPNNVGYAEIVVEGSQKRPRKKFCPQICKFIHDLSAETHAQDDVEGTVRKGQSKLDEDKKIMFKSFQILDSNHDEDNSEDSLVILTKKIAKNLDASLTVQKKKEALQTIESCGQSIPFARNDQLRVNAQARTPWDLGLYQTKATQCSSSLVVDKDESSNVILQPRDEPRRSIELKKIKSNDVSPKVSSTDESPKLPEQDMTQDKNSSSSSSEKEISSWENVPAKKEQSVVEKKSNLVNQEDGGSPRTNSPSVSICVPKEHVHRASSSLSNAESVKDLAKHASFTKPVGPQVEVKTIYSKKSRGLKSPDGSPAGGNENVEKQSNVTVYYDAKKVVKPLIDVPKIDVSLQTSFTSTSESDLESLHNERTDTVEHFIRGLTGKSEEVLDKFRSSPSFPKVDISGWSKTAMKTLKEQNSKTGNKSELSVFEEKIMDTTDYVDNANCKHPGDSDAEASVSGATKGPRFGEKMDGAGEKGNKLHSMVVMRMGEERDDAAGEGRASPHSKQHLPFYRRVLGRILDPSSKMPMRASQSDPNPIDESISEGEIRHKSTTSIGEVIMTSKGDSDRKRSLKTERHFRKHFENPLRKELGDKSIRIARQRVQYNNWVTYYLQKQNNCASIDDSSSQSIIDGSAK